MMLVVMCSDTQNIRRSSSNWCISAHDEITIVSLPAVKLKKKKESFDKIFDTTDYVFPTALYRISRCIWRGSQIVLNIMWNLLNGIK